MRYQKWGRAGYKIYCYSQDKGKPHLSHGDKCDNLKIWASDLESAVKSDLFMIADKEIEDEREERKDASEYVDGQIARLNKRLKNLYNLYADSADSALADTISETKKELDRAKARKVELEKAREEMSSLMEIRSSLKKVADTWDYMTLKEKQNVLRSLIEKIVITYDKTDIYYKLPIE